MMLDQIRVLILICWNCWQDFYSCIECSLGELNIK
jgi:hypothetical protein